MSMEHSIWYWQGKTEVLVGKPVPVSLCQPQIPHGLGHDWTQISAVWGRRVPTWRTSVCKVKTIRAGCSRNLGSIHGKNKTFWSPKRQGRVAPLYSTYRWLFNRRQGGRAVKLTAHLQLHTCCEGVKTANSACLTFRYTHTAQRHSMQALSDVYILAYPKYATLETNNANQDATLSFSNNANFRQLLQNRTLGNTMYFKIHKCGCDMTFSQRDF